MMTLVVGGSGSGKSAYAEELLSSISQGKKKYYIATMQAFDQEGQEKIQRHRILRKGKGFHTIEQPVSIEKAMEKMAEGEKTALLECMSNLVANEMFSQGIPENEKEVAERILAEVTALEQGLAHLVIVTNNVFEDGDLYDQTTLEYMRSMGRVNEALGVMADQVVEVVVGIPVVLKCIY